MDRFLLGVDTACLSLGVRVLLLVFGMMVSKLFSSMWFEWPLVCCGALFTSASILYHLRRRSFSRFLGRPLNNPFYSLSPSLSLIHETDGRDHHHPAATIMKFEGGDLVCGSGEEGKWEMCVWYSSSSSGGSGSGGD